MIADQLLTANELSELLGLNIVTIYRHVRDGNLRATKRGRTYVVRLTDVLTFVEQRGVAKQPIQLTPDKKQPKPFLKWAGGKRQMLPYLSKWVPEKFGTYFEPFLGGGALFFHLRPKKARLSDSNHELINTFTVVRDNVEQLISSLSVHKNSKSYYYHQRSLNPTKLDPVTRASRTIYLNKSCFNGLYRVNKSGQFNVPFGNKVGAFLVDIENLRLASDALQNVDLCVEDYREALQHASKGDFVYLDPPYHPAGGYSDFQRYTPEFFYEHDHERLRDQFDILSRKGVHAIQSNSNTPFIRDRYHAYPIEVVKTKRLISSKASTRTGEDVVIFSHSLHA